MAEPGLSPLQKRILKVLAMLEPPWTLTGGGALALCYLGDQLEISTSSSWDCGISGKRFTSHRSV